MRLALVGGRGPSGVGTTTFYLSEWLRSSHDNFQIFDTSLPSLLKLGKFRTVLLVGTLLSILPVLTFARLKKLKRSARVMAYIAHEGVIPGCVSNLLEDLDMIVAPSNWNYELFRSAFHGEIKVIPHGIDTHLFRPLNQESRPFDLAFLTPSWARHRKGVDIARRVIRQLDAKVLVNFHAWFNSEMKGLRHRLERFEETSYRALPRFYNMTRMLLFPSRSEGFGLPALEAMACGTPLVYSDAPAHNEFAVGLSVPVSRTYSGRKDFSPFNLIYYDTEASKYVHQIELLLDDEAMYENLAAKARSTAEHYDFRITFEGFRDLLA